MNSTVQGSGPDADGAPLIIGYHARVPGDRAENWGASAVAITQHIAEKCPRARAAVAYFADGPRNGRMNVNATSAIAAARAAPNTFFLYHAAYIDLPWSRNVKPAALARLRAAMEACEAVTAAAQERGGAALTAPVAGLVVHGSAGAQMFDVAQFRERTAALCAALNGVLRRADDPAAPPIYIETMPHDARYADPRALNALFDETRGVPIGLCVDTAHIWGAGADIANADSALTWFDALRKDIPVAIHLNDSTREYGSHSDCHTPLGTGTIWSPRDLAQPRGLSARVATEAAPGYTAILDWACDRGAPVILERGCEEMVAVDHDLSIVADWYTNRATA